MFHNTGFYNTSSDYVYNQLRGRIIDKSLKPGQRLPEVKIATEMGVSRTPVREALRRLSAEGLVRVIPNSGARVSSPTASEMESAYAVREYLESLSVNLACKNGLDRRTMERMEEILSEEETAFNERNLDAFLDGNNSFHRLLAEASRNSVLSEYIDNIMLRTNVYILFYDPFNEKENYSTSEHRAILRAIAKRDIDGAERLIREHLSHSHKALAVPADRTRIG
jgi:DNA-binding GntR family transcriptional regulator